MSAIGGENVTTTVEGRERYPVNVRYLRAIPRQRSGALDRVLVPASWTAQQQIPHRRSWRTSKLVAGPSMFRDENGMLSGYVYVDVAGPRHRHLCRREAKQVVRDSLRLPPGYTLAWSGQYETMRGCASG